MTKKIPYFARREQMEIQEMLICEYYLRRNNEKGSAEVGRNIDAYVGRC